MIFGRKREKYILAHVLAVSVNFQIKMDDGLDVGQEIEVRLFMILSS